METKDTSKHSIKFTLGTVVATRAASEDISMEDIQKALGRHVVGDWGSICEEDAQANNAALSETEPGRIMSVYKDSKDVVFWIITEWDRSVTTVLLPSDY